MSNAFQPGDVVRQRQGAIGQAAIELVVESYDPFGRVICSFWRGISRAKMPFREMELEKIPMPESGSLIGAIVPPQ
jgi:hypothetical protein